MKKEKIKYFLKHLFLFLVQIAFSRELFGQVFPFGFVFALSRVYFGANLLLVSIEYAISNIFVGVNFYYIISAAFEIVILALYYFFKETVHVKRKRLFLSLFLMLSLMLKLYLCLTGNLFYLHFIFESILKFVALFYFFKLYEIYRKKLIFSKCSNTDYLFFSTFVVIFVLGLFKYTVLKDSIGICLFLTALIFSSRCLPTDRFLVFAITLTICFGYVFSSISLVLCCLIAAIVLISVARLHKYLFLPVVLVCGVILIKISSAEGLLNYINLFSSVCLVALVPQKIVNKIIEFFEEKSLNIINENMWHESQLEIKAKLDLMSKTLKKMQDDFKFLIVGKIDRRLASEELAKDVIKNCCEACDRKFICSNSLIDKQKILSEFMHYAIMKGSFSVDELSVGFRTYCDKTMLVASSIASVATRYLKFETSVKTEDESKLLISSELGNFANLFRNFSNNIGKISKINKNMSKLLKESLSNNMVDVVDIAVFENHQAIEKIDIVAENNVMAKRELRQCLSRFMGGDVQVKKLRHLELSGLSLISFVPSNELKLEFAVSSSAKETVNGDNTLIAKIDDNRFFVAIADGMGHGKVAGKTSQMILNLIKNLFLIGIELDLIIESVNKLLIPVGLDNFSTLDIAIVDLKQSNCCFIKLGSSVSVIKHSDTTEIISSSSLPVGIIQNLTPTIEIRKIHAGDVLLLASDGVVDSFASIESYKIFINDCKIGKLQNFTDNIIFELKSKANKHLDDMSIIAIKLLKNSQK